MRCISVAIKHTIGQPAIGGCIRATAAAGISLALARRSGAAGCRIGFIAPLRYPALRFQHTIGSVVMHSISKIFVKQLIGTRPNFAWQRPEYLLALARRSSAAGCRIGFMAPL